MVQNISQLVAKQDLYDLVITNNVYKKIQQWCKICPRLEWSGYLFYHIEGSLKNKDLKITTDDFLVLNIGDSTATTFTVTPEVTLFMVDNNLVDSKIGLIHSHNQMAAFFSATDNNTLLEEGSNTCNFLSLIVNNAESYVARVTSQIVTSFEGIKQTCIKSYDIEDTKEERVNIKKLTNVAYYDLNIIIEGKEEVSSEIINRFNELNKKNTVVPYTPSLFDSQDSYFTNKQEIEEPKSPTLNKNYMTQKASNSEDLPIDDTIILDTLSQLIFGNPLNNYTNTTWPELTNYLKLQMAKDYDEYYESRNINYEDYCALLCDFVINNIKDKQLETYLINNKLEDSLSAPSTVISIYAEKLLDKLLELNNGFENYYLGVIIENINSYIIYE